MTKPQPKTFLNELLQAAQHRPHIAALVPLCLAGFGLLGYIASEVSEGESLPVDRQILLALRNPDNTALPLGPGWLAEVMRDITGLGGVFFLSFLTLASFIYLLVQRRKREAFYLILSVGTGIAFNCLLKGGFQRARPDLFPHGSMIYTSSFPSGHSMMSATVYLTLGALLAEAHARQALKIYFLGLSILLTLMIGISRLYLAVHWPTDVLAGWLGGAAWAIMAWLVSTIVLHHTQKKRL